MMNLTYEEYYGDDYVRLKHLEKYLIDLIKHYPIQANPEGIEPILYCKSRIKQPEYDEKAATSGLFNRCTYRIKKNA